MSNIDDKIEQLIDQQSLIDQSADGKSLDPLEHEDQQRVDFELQLQAKIDASLARCFPSTPTQDQVHRKKMETLISSSSSKMPNRRSMNMRIWALAASLLLLTGVLFWRFNTDVPPDVVFNRKPLSVLYQDSVERGFKPYYVCDEPVRFAAEFKRSQGVPLRLKEMPANKQMVGIDYMGGISRTSTAMLGLVDDEPVLVFVDNLSNDDEEMLEQVGENDGYHISRATKDDLVYYEISKNENAQFIDYFERVESESTVWKWVLPLLLVPLIGLIAWRLFSGKKKST